MGLEVQINMAEIRDTLMREAEKNQERVIALLRYVGETVVNDIRTSHISEWNDQTGNLRSSIGYIICVDGQPITVSKFQKVIGPNPKDGEADGATEGRNYAHQLASVYSRGIALIIVAGMEYASYVENRDNKVVLAQGEIEAKKLVAELISKLNRGAKLPTV